MTPQDKREPLKNGITRITSGATGEVSYEARVSYTDATGKRRYRRERARTLRAAQQTRARMVTDVAEGKQSGPSRLTLDEWADRWFTRRSRDWTDATAYTRRRQYRRYIQPVLGHVPLRKISRGHCQALADDLADQFQASTVHNTMAVLIGMMGGAQRDELIIADPTVRLDLPTVKRKQHAVWSAAEVRQFLDHTRGHRHWPIYVLMLSTGMRIGEAIALTWEQVDLDNATITVNATLRRTRSGAMEPQPGAKSAAGNRVLPLSDDVVGMLRRMDQSTAYVFVGSNGTYLDYSEIARQLVNVQKELGPKWTTLTAHGMRHTWATALMRAGVHPELAKTLLGHAHVSLTMDTYTHPSTSDLIPAMRVAASALGVTIDTPEDDNT